MATNLLSPEAKQQFFINGVPAAGAKLYTYATGSTTPALTYQDAAGTTPNAIPVILDAEGYCTLYLAPGYSYRYVLKSATDVTQWTRDGIIAAAGDATAVAYTVAGSSTSRTLGEKWTDSRTVEDFGAIGDGVTNDAAAFTAMAAATGGRIVMLDKEYWVGVLSLSGYTALSIIGSKMPRTNSALTKLTSGSILIGRLDVRCNDVTVRDFGVDCGTGRANAVSAGITEGTVIDAVAGERGNRIIARNIACNGASELNPTHSFLAEGYDHGDIDNIYVANHRYGVVYKGRNAQIRNIDADKVNTVACYIKADLPASAGNVLDATVQNVQVYNVRHRPSNTNTTATAVTVHASSAACANVQVSGASITFGGYAVTVQGGGLITDPVISSIIVTNSLADGAQGGVLLSGYNYDCIVSDVKAINPVTGSGIDTSSATAAAVITGVNVLISNPAITAANMANLAGTLQWDNFTARNPYRTMLVNQALGSYGTIVPGQYSGDMKIFGEGTLTFNNLVGAGTPAPAVKINPGGVIQLVGQLSCTVATGTSGMQAATLPFSITGPRTYLCAGMTGGGTLATCVVRVNGTAIFVDNVYTGYQWIDLSPISFRQ